jgi:hypothetical protein
VSEFDEIKAAAMAALGSSELDDETAEERANALIEVIGLMIKASVVQADGLEATTDMRHAVTLVVEESVTATVCRQCFQSDGMHELDCSKGPLADAKVVFTATDSDGKPWPKRPEAPAQQFTVSPAYASLLADMDSKPCKHVWVTAVDGDTGKFAIGVDGRFWHICGLCGEHQPFCGCPDHSCPSSGSEYGNGKIFAHRPQWVGGKDGVLEHCDVCQRNKP